MGGNRGEMQMERPRIDEDEIMSTNKTTKTTDKTTQASGSQSKSSGSQNSKSASGAGSDKAAPRKGGQSSGGSSR
jgi:hypothetical protein